MSNLWFDGDEMMLYEYLNSSEDLDESDLFKCYQKRAHCLNHSDFDLTTIENKIFEAIIQPNDANLMKYPIFYLTYDQLISIMNF